MRDMRVRVERDVGDAVALRDEEPALRQPALHHAQRGVSRHHALLQPGFLVRGATQIANDVARRGDEGLMAVLLEEHPLQHPGLLQAVLRP